MSSIISEYYVNNENPHYKNVCPNENNCVHLAIDEHEKLMGKTY